MKKILSLTLILILSLFLLSGCGSNESNTATGSDTTNDTSGETSTSAPSANSDTVLNLFTWEGMFPQEVLDEFTSETGIEINYVNFDYDETMLTKLEAANGGDYDLIIADDYIIETVIAEGLAQKLDPSKISNHSNINEVYQGQFYDPTDEYTIPYGAGVQTIVYDPSSVTTEINGYADLWSEDLKDNLGVIAGYRVINGMALKIMGESYNTEDVSVIESAGEKLLELAPNIRLIKDDNIQDDLISGEIGAAVMYTSQVTMAKLANPDLEIVYPSEGIGFGIMAQFIPSNAPHAAAAYAFMDYILQPEVSAKCFEYLGYYCTNLEAEQYISEEFKDFLTLPEDFDGETEMIQNVSSEAEEAHSKIWTEFKSAAGE